MVDQTETGIRAGNKPGSRLNFVSGIRAGPEAGGRSD